MADTRDYEEIAAIHWDELYDRAVEVRERAWVPYSEFAVGAAISAPSGEIFVGCNIENASIGATVCAERTAIGTAVADGVQEFRALCVVTAEDDPTAPCGICRQVLNEFAPELPILMANLDGETAYATLDELLPRAFSRAGPGTPDDEPH